MSLRSFTSLYTLDMLKLHPGRFREGVAKDALVVCFKELGSAFLSHIVERLHQAKTWQAAEVCLFVAASLGNEVLAIIDPNVEKQTTMVMLEEQTATKLFLSTIFQHLPGSTAVIQRGNTSEQLINDIFISNTFIWRYAWTLAFTKSNVLCCSSCSLPLNWQNPLCGC